jgi:hypothetical protein
MSAIIDNNMVSLLSLALDAAGMRQQAIAHNIANVNTPGFRRVAVSFEQQVAALEQRGMRSVTGAPPSLADLAGIRPHFIAADPAGAATGVAGKNAAASGATLAAIAAMASMLMTALRSRACATPSPWRH